MLGKPTRPSKLGQPEIWTRRGGLGRSNSGTHAAVGKAGKKPPPQVRVTIVPIWARKYQTA